MFAKAFLTLAVAVSGVLSQGLTINTPASLVQCQPALISWAGGQAPFILAVIPGEQTGAAAIATLSTSLTSSPYTWIVDIASGTFITLRITDGAGSVQYSSALTIQAGASDSCLNASASTSGLQTTGPVTTTGTGSATLSGTTSASAQPSGSTTSAAASSAAASSAAASSATSRPASTSANSTPVSSTANTASSAAASPSPTGGAMAMAVPAVPVLAAGLIGGIAMLI